MPQWQRPRKSLPHWFDVRPVQGKAQKDERPHVAAFPFTNGFFSADEAARKALQTLNPYELRAKGLDQPLKPEEFARALFHINQRRGFKSNRKTDKKDNDIATTGLPEGYGSLSLKALLRILPELQREPAHVDGGDVRSSRG
jgi:hypothetical protein